MEDHGCSCVLLAGYHHLLYVLVLFQRAPPPRNFPGLRAPLPTRMDWYLRLHLPFLRIHGGLRRTHRLPAPRLHFKGQQE